MGRNLGEINSHMKGFLEKRTDCFARQSLRKKIFSTGWGAQSFAGRPAGAIG
jgi:hypothetical protein